MTRARVVALVIAALIGAGGCTKDATCKPGTLFIKLAFDAASTQADHLRIVVVTDTRHETTIAYAGGTTLQVLFPNDVYPAGASADITVEALVSGVVVGTAKQLGYELPKGCGALTLTFGVTNSTDLARGDQAGLDLFAIDQSASVDAADTDMEGGDLAPGEDLAGITLLANGAACASSVDCASENCIDGYCCDTPCDGQCQACDADSSHGTCVGVNGAPHGARTACGGSGECAGSCVATTPNVCTFPGAAVSCREQSCTAAVKTLAAVCDGAGTCPALSTFACPSSACNGSDCLGGCTTNGDCTSTGTTPYCNLPEGVCRATKDEGETCANNTECTSAHCVDGFCCDGACDGQCQACNLTGGSNKPGACAKVTSGQPVTNATTTRLACTGSGTCKGTCDGTFFDKCHYPNNTVDCGTTCSCNNGTGTCACSGTCALASKTLKKCDEAGACMTMAPAVPCAGNICNAGATDCGTCGTDTDCGSGRYCDAGNVCRVKRANGLACSLTGGDHECANGHCVGGTCCNTGCSGTTPVCKADGSACSCTGTSCTGGNSCVNSVCCNDVCPACVNANDVTTACGTPCTKNCSLSCNGSSCCDATCTTCLDGTNNTNGCGQSCGTTNCFTQCNGSGTCCKSAPVCSTAPQNDGCSGQWDPTCPSATSKCDGACGCIANSARCCNGIGGEGWIICEPPYTNCNGSGGCCGGGSPPIACD